MSQVIFPYDRPIYVGTVGVDGIDDILATNPFPFNPGDGADRPTVGANGGPDPLYPVPYLTGTVPGDLEGFSPVFFIAYSATYRVEVHGRPTGLSPGDPIFQIPEIIAPGIKVPTHGTASDFEGGWRGYIDEDGTVYYMTEF